MQLPRVTFPATPDDVERGQRRVGAAAQGLGDVISQGLALYGQELVKGQTIEAQLSLTKGLDEIEQELKVRKAIPLAELQERLGDRFDALPAEIREQPIVRMKDPDTGEESEQPALVPMWAVADRLFDLEAEKALGAAMKHITVGRGWQGSFQQAARGELLSRKARVNEVQLPAMHTYQVETRTRQILEAANRGDFGPEGDDKNLGDAGAMIAASIGVLGTDGAEKLRQEVLARKLAAPIEHARTQASSDAPQHRDEAKRRLKTSLDVLSDPSKFQSVSPEHRAALASKARSTLHGVEEIEKKRLAAASALGYANAATSTANPRRVDQQKAYDALDADVAAGTLSPEAALDVRRLLGEVIRDRDEAAKAALSELAGRALGEFMAIGPDGKPRLRFSNVSPEVLIDLGEFGQDGQAVVEHLVRWDQSNEQRDRQLRQLPTPDQDARALAMERAIRRDPDTFRKMATVDLLAVMTGKAPVPGEEDAPAVALSSAHLPQIRTMLAANAAPPNAVNVVPPGKIAQEEFERAFGLENMKSKRWTDEQRKALSAVTDDVAKWVNSERAKGRDPSDDEIRKHLVGEGGLLQRLDRKKILGLIPVGPKTPLHERLKGGPESPAPSLPAGGGPPAAPARPRAVNVQQVPLAARQRVIDDYRAKFGRAPGPTDIVRGYNAGVEAGEF